MESDGSGEQCEWVLVSALLLTSSVTWNKVAWALFTWQEREHRDRYTSFEGCGTLQHDVHFYEGNLKWNFIQICFQETHHCVQIITLAISQKNHNLFSRPCRKLFGKEVSSSPWILFPVLVPGPSFSASPRAYFLKEFYGKIGAVYVLHLITSEFPCWKHCFH